MSENKITRRNLLKTVIAASGAIAASTMLPSEWVKPIVTSGVLPVHAQSSAKRYVKGYTDDSGVYAGVSSDPEEFLTLNEKTRLVQSGGHAKHANPARSRSTLGSPVKGAVVKLYISTTEEERGDLRSPTGTTDESGYTKTWVLSSGDDEKWCHFVISGGEDSLQWRF